MNGQFYYCEAGLPVEPYAQRYEIITRCCEFLDGEPFGEIDYHICRAKYAGNGIWVELDTFDCRINPNEDDCHDCHDGMKLVSAGMKVEFDHIPDYFEFGGNADLKRGVDVVAYAPLPDVPDLSGLKPMEVE